MKIKYIFIILIFILACSKESSRVLPVGEGALEDAGLIENFELWEPPADAVHIDPTNLNDEREDGTIEHPYSSFDKVTWQDNTVYALKRGTIHKSSQIMISGNGVTLASYGKGAMPVIYCTDVSADLGNRHAIICNWEGINNTTIRDLDIMAPEATSSIRFLSNCQGISIINCKIHEGEWGIRSIKNNDLYIYNTEIYNIGEDGVFIEDNNQIEIANCYVHHVNTKWQPPSTPDGMAGGDGIQLAGCNNWWVHHNHIDRMNSGNKFCFISNNEIQNDGILEFNIMEGPLVNGACVYFHDGNGLIVRNNFMTTPAGSPVFTHGSGLKIYGNIFYKCAGALTIGGGGMVYNNVFYSLEQCIYGNNIDASNNVFDSEGGKNILRVNNLRGSNNLFVSGTPTEGSISGDPMFTDAENGDFHILQGSDCIDNGINVGLTNDLDGNSIPQGENPDIGVYEYVGN